MLTTGSTDNGKQGQKGSGKKELFGSPAAGRARTKRPRRSPGTLLSQPVFSTPGVSPFDEKEWTVRKAEITNEKGVTIFQQDNLEFPKEWSQTAVTVVASKYFRGHLGTGEREHSLQQLIARVVDSITEWGLADGYFTSEQEAGVFGAELAWLLLNQHASFNSPVWFNVGVETQPQCSACFINNVDDTMDSILDLVKTEGMLFKYGSGSGVNLSSIRSSSECLSGGGTASGPVSFMRGFDAFAGVIKSGGKTRRAAKMVVLNVDHPDIKEFIECKSKEERKARALIEMGFEGGIDGDVYNSIMFQNANNSVRVSDRFMESVLQDTEFHTQEVTTGKKADPYRAKELLRLMAECAHFCGDPGLQFDDAANAWHTCPNGGRINASNPCSEFMFLDNSACNLSSLNLLKFLGEDGNFQVDRFKSAVDIMALAQEIIVERASYPTPQIRENSVRYRPLGLGFANLGALLMACGHPYDSEEGRALAGAITALMTGEAYSMSARVARKKGAFETFEANKGPMLQVIRKHRHHVDKIDAELVDPQLLAACRAVWKQALRDGEKWGFKNAQVSVLAPTGTIGFMMDCDTTGVEPDIALVKYKKLVGGGMMKIVNRTVDMALESLGYSPEEAEGITGHIDATGTIEGADLIREKDLSVFDCALVPAQGSRSIHYRGHLLMLAAVQPFISGSISKTVNVPKDATVDEIYNVFVEAWQMGLKAISIYRDGSKVAQPLTTGKGGKATESKKRPPRRRLPDERQAITHKFSISGHEGYMTVGMYEDGTPGEVFIVMAKQGSTVSGLMDAFATAISLALQHGVPLSTMVDKFSHLRFEPAGFTNNPEIPMAKSVMDYIFRWMQSRFMTADGKPKMVFNSNGIVNGNGNGNGNGNSTASTPQQAVLAPITLSQEDAPICHNCGDVMTRNGTCYKCNTCGETSGCS